MLWVQEIQVGVGPPSARLKVDARQQAAAGKLRRRRRWILISLAQFVILGLVVTLVLAWQRDQRTLHVTLGRLDKPMTALQESVDRWQTLPATLPVGARYLAYANDADRFYAMNTSDPVIIAFTQPVDMTLKQDIRGVLIFQRDEQGRGRITRESMSTAEFFRRWTTQERTIREWEKERLAQPLELP